MIFDFVFRDLQKRFTWRKIDGKGMIVLNILVWNLWAVLSLRQFILILYFKHFYLRFCFYIPLNNNFIIHYLLFYDVFYLWEFILNNCHFSYIKDYDGGILMECKIDPKLPYTDLSTMIRRQRQVRWFLFASFFFLCIIWDTPRLVHDKIY